MIEQLAPGKGHQIVSKVSPKEPTTSITIESVASADVCLDFSHPHAVLNNIKSAASCGKNIVVGTTGWYSQLSEVQKIVEKYGVGLVYSPNFSIGVRLFLKMVEEAALLMDLYDEYDVAGFEAHHAKKLDCPSGTAEAMMSRLLNTIQRKKKIRINSLREPLEKDEIHLSSLRCGSIPGEHRVIFDSGYDTIEIKHSARSREGFAHGALTAAEWLQDKKGFFTLDALLNL
jgi:4-hydroxy-tetrahydrodipicolinate reductase